MLNIFKKKQSAPAQPVDMDAKLSSKKSTNWIALLTHWRTNNAISTIREPWTLAQERLEGHARDIGAANALRMYNAHKTRLQNQWINPLVSVNSGFGTAQNTFYMYQNVNYYQCYQLAQDPLFAKVFNMLSQTPFAKGGMLSAPDSYDLDALDRAADKFNLWNELRGGVRSSYVTGGCLVYLDFGQTEMERARPLNIKSINCKKFRGFRHIDPINITATNVNTVDPSSPDYMKPETWYVIGLGTVHRSHFLHFEANPPELPLRPMTLYFGMPLTQLIKQDIANSNLSSQGLANLINRSRYVYMTADDATFATDNSEQFRARLEWMSGVQDNFSVAPIKQGETVQQLTTSLAGFAESVELMYLLVSAKTDIPFTELMGKSASGMNATGEGDRRKWYDKCHSIQRDVMPQLLTMYGIVAGRIGDGKFVEFDDFVYNPLEEATEKELAENIKAYTDVATALNGLGANPDSVIEWLKQFRQFHLDAIEFDTSTPGLDGYDDDQDDPNGGGMPQSREDITPQVLSAVRAMNAKKDAKGMLHDESNGQFTSGGDTGFNQPGGDGPSGEHMAIKCHVDLDGSQICEFDESTMDRTQYIKDVREWFRENLKDETEESPVIGRVNFHMSGIDETISKNLGNIDNLKFVPAVRPILKQSTDVREEIPAHDHSGKIYKFERVFGIANYKGELHHVSFLVAVDSREQKFYMLDIPEKTLEFLNKKEPENIAESGENQVPLNNSVAQERYVVNLFIED